MTIDKLAAIGVSAAKAILKTYGDTHLSAEDQSALSDAMARHHQYVREAAVAALQGDKLVAERKRELAEAAKSIVIGYESIDAVRMEREMFAVARKALLDAVQAAV